MAEEKITDSAPVRIQHFIERYANNIQFESTVWDLKLIFGLLDQASPGRGLKQHTAINMTWAQAKVLLYFVYVNLLFHEASNGPVIVPAGVKPASFDAFLDEMAVKDPQAIEMKDRINKLYAELF